MIDHRLDEVVDEAFFGWSHDSGEHTIVSSSLDQDRRWQWRSRLQDHVRLQPVGDLELPEAALSYLEFDDGTAAVLRRVPRGSSAGRGNTHVLIGTTGTLGASLAVRLENWEGWRDTAPPGQMGTIAPAHLASVAGSPERLLNRARPLERQLVDVVTRLLEYPTLPLSIVGCPDGSRLPLVWALRRATEAHLEQERRQRRRWTFSTYEDRHGSGVRNMPEIVFLPALPSTGEAHQRSVVRLDEPVTNNSQFADLAAQLVTRLFHTVSPPPRQHSEPQTQRVVPPPPPQPAPSRRTVQESVVPQSPPAQAASNARKELAVPLLGARTPETFLDALRWLSTKDRHQLRAAFDVDAVNRAVDFVEVDSRIETLQRILHMLYGPDLEDLRGRPDVQEHAAGLVRNCRSDQLAAMLGRGALDHARREVSEQALERTLQHGGPLKPPPSHRVLDELPWVRSRRLRLIGAAVGAFLLLVLGIVSGYLMGRPASAVPPVNAAPSTPAVAASTPVGQRPVLKSGTAQVEVAVPGQRLYAFVVGDDRYFPQQACTPLGGGNLTWNCEQVYEPPLKAGTASTLVAVVVRDAQVDDLGVFAGEHKGIGWMSGWTNQVPVRP